MLFFYRFVTVVALGLLGLGLYSTIDQENHLTDSTHARPQMRRRLNPGPEDQAVPAKHQDLEWLQSDTVVTDTTFRDSQGSLHSLRVLHIWQRDTLMQDPADPRRVTFYLDNDTLHFLSYAIAEGYRNGGLLFRQTIHRNTYRDAVDTAYLNVYMLQRTHFAGYSESSGLYILEQPLGLPSGISWTRTWLALDTRGQVKYLGNAGTCDGGVQLSANGQHLLTCHERIALATQQKYTLPVQMPAVVRWLNDTLYVTVEDMPEGVEPNAQIYNLKGESLLSFMYHGYEREDFYQSGVLVAGQYAYFMAPQVQELITIQLNDLDAADVLYLGKLKRYRTPQYAKRGGCFNFRRYEHCCLYLDAAHKPIGYTLVNTPEPL
ncbi:MAG: hypothetical protein KF690_02985 [Bacteroidetes bacterium]|nr:hypothetical protein [Bacteroidota bacterium]